MKITDDDVKKIEGALVSIYGNGSDSDFVKFIPFHSYFGMEEAGNYTDTMVVTFGHLCQTCFGHNKKPTIAQIKKIDAVLMDMASVVFEESYSSKEGRFFVHQKSVRLIIYAKVLIRNEGEPVGDIRADDYFELSFYRRYFDSISKQND